MVKCAKENRIVLAVLAICLFFILTISSGCKKKEQSEEARQNVPAEEITPTSTPEQVVQAGTSEKIDLRILYAGLPNTDRAKDFVDFLSKHFKQVETTDYNTLEEDNTDGFDVTIIDYDGHDTRAPLPSISREYSRATITIGSPGADLSSRLSLKTGYL
jgi:uncharacterized lipoprotein YehR (DUF1307 family)